MSRRSLVVVLAFGSLFVPAHAGVQVVDANLGPGSTYSDIQSAIDAATDGDLIIVRHGSYPGFAIIQRSLAIVAEAGAIVNIGSETKVASLLPSQRAIFRGLKFSADTSCSVSNERAVVVSSNDIVFEDCTFANGKPTVEVQGSATFARCTLTGRGPKFDCFGGGPSLPTSALVVSFGVAYLESCTLVGGKGADAAFSAVIPGMMIGGDSGAAALRLSSATVFAGGSTFVGGNGGTGGFNNVAPVPFCVGPGAGGYGALVEPGGNLQSLDSTFTPGIAGTTHAGCLPAPPTPPVIVQGGTYVTIPGDSNKVVTSSPVRESQFVQWSVTGNPGDNAILFVGVAPGALYVPAAPSYLYMQLSPLFLVSLGTLPANGQLLFSSHVPSFLAPGAWAQVWMQCVTCDPSTSDCHFGAASITTLLDSLL